MVLSHKSDGMRGGVCTARGETRNGRISNMFYVRSPLCRVVLQGSWMWRGHSQAFFSRILWPLDQREKVLQRTAHLASWLTFSSDNLACSQLSKSHGPGPKMINTHCFLNTNHRAQPSCKTDVRQYDCAVVVPSRTWLSVDMAYFCLVLCLFSNAVSLSLLLWFLFFFFFCIDDPRASDWLMQYIFFFFSPFLLMFSQTATLCLSLCVIHRSAWRNPPEQLLTLGFLTLGYLSLHLESQCFLLRKEIQPFVFWVIHPYYIKTRLNFYSYANTSMIPLISFDYHCDSTVTLFVTKNMFCVFCILKQQRLLLYWL